MQSNKFLINVVLLGLLLTAGCVQVSDQGSDSGQSTQAEEAHILVGSLTEINQIDDTQNPYTIATSAPPSFEVNLSMPTNFTTLQKLNHDQTVLWQKDPKSLFLDSDNMEPGEVYTYQIGNIVGGKFVMADSWKVEIPFDLIIAGSVDVASIPAYKLTKIRDLIFTDTGAVLTLESANVTLRAHEILSSNGNILAFAGPNAFAATFMRGASAGSLTLSADIFHGHLNINLDGQGGGNFYQGNQAAPTGGAAGTVNLSLPSDADCNVHASQGSVGILHTLF